MITIHKHRRELWEAFVMIVSAILLVILFLNEICWAIKQIFSTIKNELRWKGFENKEILTKGRSIQ